MKTAQQLIDFIKENNLQRELFNIYEEDTLDLSEEQHEFLGKIENKETICNSDEMLSVIYFEDHDVYLKLTGEYDSYGQGEHEVDHEVTQVYPKEITTTIYE